MVFRQRFKLISFKSTTRYSDSGFTFNTDQLRMLKASADGHPVIAWAPIACSGACRGHRGNGGDMGASSFRLQKVKACGWGFLPSIASAELPQQQRILPVGVFDEEVAACCDLPGRKRWSSSSPLVSSGRRGSSPTAPGHQGCPARLNHISLPAVHTPIWDAVASPLHVCRSCGSAGQVQNRTPGFTGQDFLSQYGMRAPT